MKDRAFGLLAVLYAASDAYREGLGGKNEMIRWALLVGMLSAWGLCVFCERREKKKGEGREGKGEGSSVLERVGFGVALMMLVSLKFDDGFYGRHVVFGRVFAGCFGMLVCAFFALRWRSRKEARECDGEGRPDKLAFGMGIVAVLLMGFNVATGVYGSNFMLPCIFFGCLGVSMCLEYILDSRSRSGASGAWG
jgi:hypothetical protein